MREPKQPTSLNFCVGFGKYKDLSVEQVYSGSKDIPDNFFITWLNGILDDELRPRKFLCNHVQYLEKEFLFHNIKWIDSTVIQKSLQHRFDSIVSSEESWMDMLYQHVAFEIDEIMDSHLINLLAPYEVDYKNTATKALTEKDCNFLEFNFFNDYIIVAPVLKEEYWFNKDNLDYFSILKRIIHKEFDDFIINGASANPGIMTLSTVKSGKIEESKFLLSGSPSYIDWALRESEDLFFDEDSLDELEKMPVTYFSGITISKVADDIVKWNVCYESYNYKFSSDARLKNKEKYDSYTVNNKKYNEFLKAEQHEEDYRSKRRRYSEQDYIDDAFGGEASAYWNID